MSAFQTLSKQVSSGHELYDSQRFTKSGEKFEGYVLNGSRFPEIWGSMRETSCQGTIAAGSDERVVTVLASSLLSLLSLAWDGGKGEGCHSRSGGGSSETGRPWGRT